MLNITLNNLDDTATLALYLAMFLTEHKHLRTVLLRGEMGSGKTTLTRILVENLENSEQAEVSSPSFTVCNYYPTIPPVLHCDLYRTGGNLPDELLEEWDDIHQKNSIIIIEWAEYISKHDLPLEYIDIHLKSCHNDRLVTIELYSPNSLDYVFTNQLNFDQWTKR